MLSDPVADSKYRLKGYMGVFPGHPCEKAILNILTIDIILKIPKRQRLFSLLAFYFQHPLML